MVRIGPNRSAGTGLAAMQGTTGMDFADVVEDQIGSATFLLFLLAACILFRFRFPHWISEHSQLPLHRIIVGRTEVSSEHVTPREEIRNRQK